METSIYKCAKCGAVVEFLHKDGDLPAEVQPDLKALTANTADAAREKHVPVIEKTADGYKVKVAEVSHPMEAKHYIMWIELITDDGYSLRKFLKPGEAPEAEFKTAAKKVTAREYCNLHGLWKAEA